MSSFIIEGGKRLSGEVIPQGAKNEALQILCAVLLTPEPVTITNLPDIVDVNKLIDLVIIYDYMIAVLIHYIFWPSTIQQLNKPLFKNQPQK